MSPWTIETMPPISIWIDLPEKAHTDSILWPPLVVSCEGLPFFQKEGTVGVVVSLTICDTDENELDTDNLLQWKLTKKLLLEADGRYHAAFTRLSITTPGEYLMRIDLSLTSGDSIHSSVYTRMIKIVPETEELGFNMLGKF